MGMAGALNDNASITAPVISFVPNDYGLFNMAGNVNEWVQDVYRPMTSTTLRDVETQDLNSFRGNIFTQVERDATGKPVPVDSLGRLKYKELDANEISGRLNFQKANVINYLDGDKQSRLDYIEANDEGTKKMYDVNFTLSKSASDGLSVMTDNSRVYKGGSWADRSYWLSPGSRRYLDQNRSTSTIGFRCAMTRVGSPKGNKLPGGNVIKTSKARTKRNY
jgi:gliding motility-associated lipoprotein GldJ